MKLYGKFEFDKDGNAIVRNATFKNLTFSADNSNAAPTDDNTVSLDITENLSHHEVDTTNEVYTVSGNMSITMTIHNPPQEWLTYLQHPELYHRMQTALSGELDSDNLPSDN